MTSLKTSHFKDVIIRTFATSQDFLIVIGIEILKSSVEFDKHSIYFFILT